MDAYIPHITISCLHSPEDAVNARNALTPSKTTFNVTSIHLANIGPDGTVNEIYKEFPFQMI
jgi:2'-5' RNA ligase